MFLFTLDGASYDCFQQNPYRHQRRRMLILFFYLLLAEVPDGGQCNEMFFFLTQTERRFFPSSTEHVYTTLVCAVTFLYSLSWLVNTAGRILASIPFSSCSVLGFYSKVNVMKSFLYRNAASYTMFFVFASRARIYRFFPVPTLEHAT